MRAFVNENSETDTVLGKTGQQTYNRSVHLRKRTQWLSGMVSLSNRGMLHRIATKYNIVNHGAELPIQAKLEISQPGDKYEQEADRVAEQVLRIPERTVSQVYAYSTCLGCQQKEAHRDSDDEDAEVLQSETAVGNIVTPVQLRQSHSAQGKRNPVQMQRNPGLDVTIREVDASITGLRSNGEPLPIGVSSEIQRTGRFKGEELPKHVSILMEQAFGVELSGVRVHLNPESDRLNRMLRARAFTFGQDIWFRQGEYNPGSNRGQRLLVHELTHVLQQRDAGLRSKIIQLTPADDFRVALEAEPEAIYTRLIQIIDSAGIEDLQEAHYILDVIRFTRPYSSRGGRVQGVRPLLGSESQREMRSQFRSLPRNYQHAVIAHLQDKIFQIEREIIIEEPLAEIEEFLGPQTRMVPQSRMPVNLLYNFRLAFSWHIVQQNTFRRLIDVVHSIPPEDLEEAIQLQQRLSNPDDSLTGLYRRRLSSSFRTRLDSILDEQLTDLVIELAQEESRSMASEISPEEGRRFVEEPTSSDVQLEGAQGLIQGGVEHELCSFLDDLLRFEWGVAQQAVTDFIDTHPDRANYFPLLGNAISGAFMLAAVFMNLAGLPLYIFTGISGLSATLGNIPPDVNPTDPVEQFRVRMRNFFSERYAFSSDIIAPRVVVDVTRGQERRITEASPIWKERVMRRLFKSQFIASRNFIPSRLDPSRIATAYEEILQTMWEDTMQRQETEREREVLEARRGGGAVLPHGGL